MPAVHAEGPSGRQGVVRTRVEVFRVNQISHYAHYALRYNR